MSSLISKINTKKEAFKLVNDPTHLFHLLYSKYGDIEEDYNILIINPLIYNKFSHINSIFKENLYVNNIKEFLRRKYNKKETKERIPKLSDYYKNYYKYFCRPYLLNYFSANLLHNYFNNQAEIFYKNNYSHTEQKKNIEENVKKSNSISSFDNDTDNNIIFDKRNKYIIDNNTDKNKKSISLTFDNSIKDTKGLVTKRSYNDSSFIIFNNFIKELSLDKNKNNNINNIIKEENNKKNDNEKITYNSKGKEEDKTDMLDDIFKKIDLNNDDKYTEGIKEHINLININKIKDKSNQLVDEINNTGSDIFKEINNNNKKLALKLSRNVSKLEELKNNKNILNVKQNVLNELSSDNMDSNKRTKYKLNKNNNIQKVFIQNSNNKNILKIKQISDKKILNDKHLEYRNSSKKEKDIMKIKDFMTIKNTKNIGQTNQIKTFKLIKYPLSNYKKTKNEKIESKKNNTIFVNSKSTKSNKKINIPSRLSNELLKKENIKNYIKNSDKLINSNKYNILFRNEFGSKKSKTSDKLTNIKNIYLQNSKTNKKVIISHKNNLSYFKNEYEQNNLLNSLKSFKSEHSQEKRNSDLISKNFLFKNYTNRKMLIRKNINNEKSTGLNTFKNFLYISRNKNKNIMKTFNSKSIPLSITQSKNGELLNNKFKTLNFINNKKIYITNLKMNNNNYQNEKIDEILKNSKIISNSLDKSDKSKNKLFNSVGIDFKNGLFSPINIKKNFNFNKNIIKNIKK